MTLVELLVALLVLSMVAGALFSIFFTSLKAYWMGDISTQVQQQGRLALDRITRDLRQARPLFSGAAGGFTFALTCTPNPQISFVLPHLGNMTLADGSTIYGPDPNASGAIPYDGSYVSYYLSAAPAGTTTNAAGPYLVKTVYDINGATLSTVTVASNITGLAFLDRMTGLCPTTSARDVIVTVTASQQASGQNIGSTDIVTSDVSLRNQ